LEFNQKTNILKQTQNIILAITGASGAIYAKQLIDSFLELRQQISNIAIVFSTNALEVWKHEIGDLENLDSGFQIFDKKNFNAPFASGSSNYKTMIIAPCSMGTLARIANGISDDLITRSADVILKERRKLILMIRETPFNLIHIENMKKITKAGGIICPAIPSFYSKPQTIQQLIKTVTDRILELADLEINTFRWNTNEERHLS